MACDENSSWPILVGTTLGSLPDWALSSGNHCGSADYGVVMAGSPSVCVDGRAWGREDAQLKHFGGGYGCPFQLR